MELIAVIMKAPTSTQRFEDATNLLNYGFSTYTLENVVPESALAAGARVPGDPGHSAAGAGGEHVVIGIGGSYLGARGVIECLCSPNYNLKKKDTPNIYFVGNGLTADSLQEIIELLEDEDFSVNVISKSGTTTEPAVAFRFFRKMHWRTSMAATVPASGSSPPRTRRGAP